jgi:hypothetical protein
MPIIDRIHNSCHIHNNMLCVMLLTWEGVFAQYFYFFSNCDRTMGQNKKFTTATTSSLRHTALWTLGWMRFVSKGIFQGWLVFIHFGPKWLNIKYFVIWTIFDPRTLLVKMAIFDQKTWKNQKTEINLLKIRWELLFCNNSTEKWLVLMCFEFLNMITAWCWTKE